MPPRKTFVNTDRSERESQEPAPISSFYNPNQVSEIKQQTKPMKNKILIAVLVVLFIAAAGAAGYFYKQYSDIKKNPQKISQDENKAIIDAVGKLIELPKDETPTIATVTDPAALKDQAFFANAQKDDKVLIYSSAKKAILYRPSTNKIVDVAPVNIGDQNATPAKTK